jgi:Zn-dependent protease with chaperone function
VRYPFLFVAGVAAALMPASLDARAAAILVSCTALFAAILAGLNLPVARALGLARPAGGRLAAVVARAGQKVGVQPRAVHVIPWSAANALALPIPRKLAFTCHILEVLDDAELEAVTVHELGHLSEPWQVSLARSSGVLVLLPLVAARPIVGSLGWPALAVAVVLVLAAIVLLRKLARRMEERADRLAHGTDPATYARALERIYRANMIPAVLPGRRRIHPDLHDRLVAAGAAPAYARPRPPSRWTSIGASLAALVPLAAWVLLAHAGPALLRAGAHSEGRILAAVAASGGGAWDLYELGTIRSRRGDGEGAVVMLRAASVVEQRWHGFPAILAGELAGAGRCDEATWLEEASRRCGEGCEGVAEIDAAAQALERCREVRIGPGRRGPPRAR